MWGGHLTAANRIILSPREFVQCMCVQCNARMHVGGSAVYLGKNTGRPKKSAHNRPWLEACKTRDTKHYSGGLKLKLQGRMLNLQASANKSVHFYICFCKWELLKSYWIFHAQWLSPMLACTDHTKNYGQL